MCYKCASRVTTSNTPSPAHVKMTRLEGTVACKQCGSIGQQEFSGELSASFPDIKEVSLWPVYVCQQVLICLKCGFAELMIPGSELERLREGSAARVQHT
jgi:hypothetical protein